MARGKTTKVELDKFLFNIEATIVKVVEIFEEHNGHPDENITIDCLECGIPTNSYSCAWGLNNHVHFYCPNCKFSFMQ